MVLALRCWTKDSGTSVYIDLGSSWQNGTSIIVLYSVDIPLLIIISTVVKAVPLLIVSVSLTVNQRVVVKS